MSKEVEEVIEMNQELRNDRMKEAERKFLEEGYKGAGIIQGKIAYINEFNERVIPEYPKWHPIEPTTILSKAIEQVEQMGNYKVMMALVDLDKSKPKEERLYTFTDIESKKLREVIYKEMEKDF